MLKNLISKPVPLPYYLSANAKSLLNALFKIDPKERLGYEGDAEEIKQHPFFADINFSDLLAKKIAPPIVFREQEPKEDIFLNSGGFENWNSWHLNVESPDNKCRKESREYYEGFTFENV